MSGRKVITAKEESWSLTKIFIVAFSGQGIEENSKNGSRESMEIIIVVISFE